MNTEHGAAGEVVARLVGVGEKLPEEIRRQIRELQADAIAPLLTLLGREEQEATLSWHCVHAVDLLAELRAPGAAEVAARHLERACQRDLDNPALSDLVQACSCFGAEILEPLLVVRARTEYHSEVRGVCAATLAMLGVRDDRIFEAIVEECQDYPPLCTLLARYGDPRGAEVVLRVLENEEIPSIPDAETWRYLRDGFAALEQLGGQLTPRLEWVRDTAREAWKRARVEEASGGGRTLLN